MRRGSFRRYLSFIPWNLSISIAAPPRTSARRLTKSAGLDFASILLTRFILLLLLLLLSLCIDAVVASKSKGRSKSKNLPRSQEPASQAGNLNKRVKFGR